MLYVPSDPLPTEAFAPQLYQAPQHSWASPNIGTQYDELSQDPWFLQINLGLMEMVEGLDGASVVDLGCGTGNTTEVLAYRVGASGRVTGIDPSDAMLSVANSKKGADNIKYIKGVAEQIAELAPAPIDSVFSFNAVHLFHNPAEVFQKCREMLRPGACLAFSSSFLPLRDHQSSCLAFVREILRLAKIAAQDPDYKRARRNPLLTAKKAGEMLHDCGFSEINLVQRDVEIPKDYLLQYYSIDGATDYMFHPSIPLNRRLYLIDEALNNLGLSGIDRTWSYVVAVK